MKPRTIFRIEHRHLETGMFRTRDNSGKVSIAKLTNCRKFLDLPMPHSSSLEDRDDKCEWYYAVKSIAQLKEWFTEQDIEELVSLGFKVVKLMVLEWREDEYQVVFKKTSIVNYREITDVPVAQLAETFE